MSASGSRAAELVDRLADGDRRALSQAISRVEDGGIEAEELVKAAYARGRDAWVVGITGGGGSGKSTLVDRLTEIYRRDGQSVGVVAIDPTSPFSGGALLGDRVRMQRHGSDPGVFVRSMATRGQLGGIAAAAFDAVNLLAAAGFDRLIVETVGVGQEEIDIVGVAHTTCVVVTPTAGDDIQAIKAGIMEIGDVFVLNKADLPGADRAEGQLHAALPEAGSEEWSPPIVRVVATEGSGIEELCRALDGHREWALEADRLTQKRRSVAAMRLRNVLTARLLGHVRRSVLDEDLEAELVAAIAAGELDPYTAADRVLGYLELDAAREGSS